MKKALCYGQFAEEDNETNESFFELRNYDPLIGRFKLPILMGNTGALIWLWGIIIQIALTRMGAEAPVVQ